MNTAVHNSGDVSGAWYQYGWVWFLIAIPLSAVVMGVLMITLATTTNNSLVVDDYYKQGKAINQDVRRDQAASSMGLTATLMIRQPDVQLQLASSAPGVSLSSASAIKIRWVHIALATHDGTAQAVKHDDGLYRATLDKPIHPGEYRVHIEPTGEAQQSSWRLVSEPTSLAGQAVVTLAARPAQTDR